MTKKAIIVLLLCFLLPLFTYAIDGGPARLAALGSPEISIKDYSTNINLFEFGFDSDIFSVKKQNILTFQPAFDAIYYKFEQKNDTIKIKEDDYGVSSAMNNPTSKFGLIYYLFDDFVILIRPYGLYSTGFYWYHDPNNITNPYSNADKTYADYSGEISISKKFNKNFALSATIGYVKYQLLWKVPGNTAFNGIEDNKPEFEISSSFFSGGKNDWSFGAAAGTKSDPDILNMSKTSIITYWNDFDRAYFEQGMEYEYFTIIEDAVTVTKTVNYGDDRGFIHIKIGASKQNSDNEIALDAGISYKPMYSHAVEETIYIDKFSGKETIDTPVTYNGYPSPLFGFFSDLKYRQITPLGMFGLKINLNRTQYEDGYRANTDGKFVLGYNFIGLEKFQFPLELYYDTSVFTRSFIKSYLLNTYDAGISLGCEIQILNDFALRLGVSYCENRNNDKVIPNFTLPLNDRLFGISSGIGFKFASTETNLTLGWKIDTENPAILNTVRNDTQDYFIKTDFITYF